MIIKKYPSHKINSNLFQFRIEQIEYANHYNSNLPHAHDYFELFLFKNKGGIHIIDFKEVPIEANSIHLILPGQVHQIGREGGCTGSVMMFSQDYLNNNANLINTTNSFPFQRPQEKPYIKTLEEDAFQFIFEMVNDVFSKNVSTGFNATEIIQSYLNIILLKVQEEFGCEKIQYSSEIVNMFRVIDKSYLLPQSANEIAQKVKVSEGVLNSMSLQETGLSIKDHLKSKRLMEIKKALLTSNYSIKSLSYDFNFSDPSYFNKFLKKELGVTPKQYRDSAKKG